MGRQIVGCAEASTTCAWTAQRFGGMEENSAVGRQTILYLRFNRGKSMDVFGKQQRSVIMSKIRSKDTKPELFVRKILFGAGYRYRLHPQKLPGKPDIVLRKHKTVIFVHGCFWHSHPGCSRAAWPDENQTYWEEKIRRNVARDKQHEQDLLKAGWRVLTVWECACRKTKADWLLSKIESFLHGKEATAQIGKVDVS